MFESFRGVLRIPARSVNTLVEKAPTERAVVSDLKPRGKIEPSPDQTSSTDVNSGLWLENARKMIPGEALAAYLSLQPILKIATDPNSLKIVIALVFLVVTIILRWIGSQDPAAPKSGSTAQVGLVALSALTYICLVYATGGQMWWHAPIPDSQLYGQIFTLALGIVGPAFYRPTK